MFFTHQFSFRVWKRSTFFTYPFSFRVVKTSMFVGVPLVLVLLTMRPFFHEETEILPPPPK